MPFGPAAWRPASSQVRRARSYIEIVGSRLKEFAGQVLQDHGAGNPPYVFAPSCTKALLSLAYSGGGPTR